jgi:hypothetical protein
MNPNFDKSKFNELKNNISPVIYLKEFEIVCVPCVVDDEHSN